MWGKVTPGSRVRLDGEVLDVLEDGTVVAGFGRDAPATAELVIEDVEVCRQTLQIAPRDYNIQRVEGVPQKTVTPSPEHMEHIRKEQALVGAAKAQRIKRPDLLQGALAGFQWPAEGPISGVYGSQRYYNGKAGRPHYGVDVAVPTGTPVLAPAAGIVTLAEPDLFFSGGTIILDHGYGFSSSFLHMSKVSVAAGSGGQARRYYGGGGGYREGHRRPPGLAYELAQAADRPTIAGSTDAKALKKSV